MCGGSGGDERGRGGVGGDFYNSRQKKSNDHDSRRRPTAAMRPHSRRQSIQQSTNIICDRTTPLKLKKLLLLMLFIYFKARHVDESSSVVFAGRDGRTADAEHQRRQTTAHIHHIRASSWHVRLDCHVGNVKACRAQVVSEA